MKCLVVGLGAMGKNHVRIYKELGVLGAVVDADPNVAEAIGKQYNVPYFCSLEKALKLDMQAASVVVPTSLHLPVATSCLRAGLHVLVEKPISDTLQNGAELVGIAQHEKKILATGYIERYNPAFRKLSEMVHAGYFGEITSVNIRRVGGLPRSADNVVLDLMTHDIDLLLSIFNAEPDTIHLHGHQANGVLNSAQALFSFGSSSATCEANWISPIKIREVSITGTNGYVHVDMIKQEMTKFESMNITSTKKKIETEVFTGEPLKIELDCFISAILLQTPSLVVSGEDGLLALKTTLRTMENINANV